MNFSLFVFLLSSFLYSQTFDITSLSKEKYWSYLLHSKNGISEIDDKSFFLANDGKVNLMSELLADIEALKKLNNNFYCKFPARREWILSHVVSLKKIVKPRVCSQLNNYLRNVNGDKITLVFPTTHINSPASMFGHTLLRIDRKDESSLLSLGVNYSAQTKESNGFAFALKGLFGFYAGEYATMPYYKKIKEYNGFENRDIWEYTLNLNKEEIRRLILHLYEIKDTFSEYYFFDENCSYNILWLLQIARPSSHLIENFNYVVPPLLTIRNTQEENMLESVKFRYSKKRLLDYLINVKLKDRNSVLEFEEKKYDKTFLQQYSLEQQAIILDVAVNRLQYSFSKNELTKKEHLKLFLELLTLRSKSNITLSYDVPKPTDPLKGHYLTRVGLLSDKKGNLSSNIRLGYHDIFDIDDGFRAGAYIDFFNLDFSKKRDKALEFDSLELLTINSYAVIDKYFQPLSWESNLGIKRWYKNEINLHFNFGVGYSYGDDSKIFYLMLKPSTYIGKHSYFGLGLKLGFIINYQSNIKLGFSAIRSYFDIGFKEDKIDAFGVFKLNKQLNFLIKYEYNNLFEEKLNFGLTYYLNL